VSLKKHLEFEKSILTVFLGVAKRFGNGKIQPIIRGGGFVMLSFGAEETIQRYNNAPSVTLSVNSTHYGVYVSGGIQMPMGKHYTRLHADLYQALELKKFGEMTRIGITAEFAF
jgi:hypothetical protein